MPVSSTVSGTTLTIQISGTLNGQIQRDFKECYRASATTMTEFVIDMAQCEFADSSGLGLLLILHGATKASALKPKLRITNCRPNIKEILRISRFDQYFEIQ